MDRHSWFQLHTSANASWTNVTLDFGFACLFTIKHFLLKRFVLPRPFSCWFYFSSQKSTTDWLLSSTTVPWPKFWKSERVSCILVYDDEALLIDTWHDERENTNPGVTDFCDHLHGKGRKDDAMEKTSRGTSLSTGKFLNQGIFLIWDHGKSLRNRHGSVRGF